MPQSELNLKQRRFVDEYLIDLNAKQAAIRAGYSAKTAEAQGSRLLRHVLVAAAIEAGQTQRTNKAGITRERVLAELELLAFSDLTHYKVDWDSGEVEPHEDAPKGAMRALQSIKRKKTTRTSGDDEYTTVEVELKLWDKPGPLKVAGQHVGLFKDKVEHTGKDGAPLAFTLKLDVGDRDV